LRHGWGIGRAADIGALGGTDEQKEARKRLEAGRDAAQRRP
jgi:hypothetical protein